QPARLATVTVAPQVRRDHRAILREAVEHGVTFYITYRGMIGLSAYGRPRLGRTHCMSATRNYDVARAMRCVCRLTRPLALALRGGGRICRIEAVKIPGTRVTEEFQGQHAVRRTPITRADRSVGHGRGEHV